MGNIDHRALGHLFLELRDLDPADIDMLTVVLVGSSETRALPRGDGRSWVYTPRGYGDKYGAAVRAEGETET